MIIDEDDQVSPFGHRRIIGSWLLPDDFRDHVRPSLVTKAKVSTVCIVIRRLIPYNLYGIAFLPDVKVQTMICF